MPQELPSTITPVTPEALFDALLTCWMDVTKSAPVRTAVVLLVAQFCVEDAWGRACHAYNLGNQKANPATSAKYQFYGCDEVFTPAQAAHWIAADPSHCHVEHQDATSVTLWCDPPHPVACFAAYESLAEGAKAWLTLQHGRFGSAWGALLSGNARLFAASLRAEGYFTAPLDHYASTLTSVQASLDKILPELNGSDSDPAAHDTERAPTATS